MTDSGWKRAGRRFGGPAPRDSAPDKASIPLPLPEPFDRDSGLPVAVKLCEVASFAAAPELSMSLLMFSGLCGFKGDVNSCRSKVVSVIFCAGQCRVLRTAAPKPRQVQVPCRRSSRDINILSLSKGKQLLPGVISGNCLETLQRSSIYSKSPFLNSSDRPCVART